MRVVFAVVFVGLLAGCGVDGEPWTPTMSGTIGVGSGGLHTSGQIGVSNGPVTISVGGGCGYRNCW
jgi:hypothetical protein